MIIEATPFLAQTISTRFKMVWSGNSTHFIKVDTKTYTCKFWELYSVESVCFLIPHWQLKQRSIRSERTTATTAVVKKVCHNRAPLHLQESNYNQVYEYQDDIASRANNTPPTGARKAAFIPAADPQDLSCHIHFMKNCSHFQVNPNFFDPPWPTAMQLCKPHSEPLPLPFQHLEIMTQHICSQLSVLCNFQLRSQYSKTSNPTTK